MQIPILPWIILNIHNPVGRICYFELVTIYMKINNSISDWNDKQHAGHVTQNQSYIVM